MSLHNQVGLSQAMSASLLAQSHGLDPRALPQHLLPGHFRLTPGIGAGLDSSLLARAKSFTWHGQHWRRSTGDRPSYGRPVWLCSAASRRRNTEKRHTRIDGTAQRMAQKPPEKPVSHQGRKNYARPSQRNDIDPSIHLVRQCSATTEERKQVEPRRRV